KYIREMRALIAKEKGDDEIWDLKLVKGGLLDIEFLTQYYVLGMAHRHPDLLQIETDLILGRLTVHQLLPHEEGAALVSAYHLYTRVLHMIRLTIGSPFIPAQAATSVLRRISAAADMPD